jgi:hypothetical protein
VVLPEPVGSLDVNRSHTDCDIPFGPRNNHRSPSRMLHVMFFRTCYKNCNGEVMRDRTVETFTCRSWYDTLTPWRSTKTALWALGAPVLSVIEEYVWDSEAWRIPRSSNSRRTSAFGPVDTCPPDRISATWLIHSGTGSWILKDMIIRGAETLCRE